MNLPVLTCTISPNAYSQGLTIGGLQAGQRRPPQLRFLIIAGLLLASAFAGAAEQGRLAPGMVNPGFAEQPRWFKESFLDLHEDVAEAAKSGRRLMLYFYQDGCPYCTKLLRDNFGQQAIADKTQRHFDVIALNIWGDGKVIDLAEKATTEKAYARALRVQFTPTLLLFDEQGAVALRLNGYVPPGKFEAALDFVGARLEQKQSFEWSLRQTRGGSVVRTLAAPVRNTGGNYVAGISVILQERLVARSETAERFYHPLRQAAMELGALLLP